MPATRPGTSRRVAAGTIALAAAALATVAGLTACGSASAPAGPAHSGTSGSGTSGSGASGSSASGQCAQPGLTVSVDTAAAGSAAGSTYYPIDVTNSSGASCRLDGYPAAWLATSAGHRIGGAAARDRGVTPHAVRLRPGGTAHAWLQVAAAGNYPPGECHPVTAHRLLVRLPGASRTRSVRLALPACSATQRGTSILTVQPIVAGRGKRGSAQ
ncbi:MAG: DUF4232 domain-containing protein [Actinomycetota bacterium]